MSRPIQASPDTIPGAGRGGGATPAAELRGVCTITEEEAVIIFRANKAERVKRDRLASRLADEYGITAKAVRDIWSLRTWIRATKPHWTSDDHTRSANKKEEDARKQKVKRQAAEAKKKQQEEEKAKNKEGKASLSLAPADGPGAVAAKVAQGESGGTGKCKELGEESEPRTNGQGEEKREKSEGGSVRGSEEGEEGEADALDSADAGAYDSADAPTDENDTEGGTDTEPVIPAPVAVDQGQLGQEARVGQDREDDDDLGWLIPAAIEPGRHQPEHAILSYFRVMNLIPEAVPFVFTINTEFIIILLLVHLFLNACGYEA